MHVLGWSRPHAILIGQAGHLFDGRRATAFCRLRCNNRRRLQLFPAGVAPEFCHSESASERRNGVGFETPILSLRPVRLRRPGTSPRRGEVKVSVCVIAMSGRDGAIQILAQAIWIAAPTLAMTRATSSSRHPMSELCRRPRTKVDSLPATKEGAERRKAHPTDAALHRPALPLIDAWDAATRFGRARLPALCRGSRQGERIRHWLSSSSRVS